MSTKWDSDPVIERFREYLRIPSVQPDVDYGDCIKFITKQAVELDLPVAVYDVAPEKPVAVITWTGTQPELPAILLNSHMDVVPVYENSWKYPPFDAVISEDGYIYARGTQDMKSVGMMHLESVRRLKSAGVRLKRTVHISFVPDEEIGGIDGMKKFVETEHFKNLNIGCSLDESRPSNNDEVIVFNGERTLRQIKITCKGEPGHGALLDTGTAGEKFYYIIDKFMKFREEERQKLVAGAKLGDVTTINLTKVEGGIQVNVLPESLAVFFDMRIAPEVDHDEFENQIENWCKEAGADVTSEYLVKGVGVQCSKIDRSAPFWNALRGAVNERSHRLECEVCPGGTDARYVRKQGIQAFGFSPIINTEFLLHAHNERIHVDVFKTGIDIMEKAVFALANV